MVKSIGCAIILKFNLFISSSQENQGGITLKVYTFYLAIIFSILILGCSPKSDSTSSSQKLKVCVTTTDLDDLVKVIGGKHVAVYCFGKGQEDPHVVDIKPDFTRQLNKADLLIDPGMGIAEGWLPELLKSAQRPEMYPKKERHLALEGIVRQLESPEQYAFEDSLHPEGNPHFLLDPVEGIKTAKLICEKLSELSPEYKDDFKSNYLKFRNEVATLLVGESLAKKYQVEKLALLYSNKKLKAFLDKNKDGEKLSGWFKQLMPFRDREFVGDHDLWPYMARTYGLQILGYLEPKPGIPPTTKHLQKLIAQMKEKRVSLILSCPYFDKRHVKFVAEKSDSIVLSMAHQVRAVDKADTYINMIKHNFELLIAGLKKTDPTK